MAGWLPQLATDEGIMVSRASRLGLVTFILLGIGVAGQNVAAAQSAADKATARKLATDGIQLFRQERIADSLDKLERAQALFEAPIHLLYIARCHAKLNHLVEAVEAYRRLVRTELSANAPQTFKDAVADGQKELPELEPKVPQLRIDVAPANLKDLRLTIDGESISTAVLGVERPINPGSHLVEIAARGRVTASRRIEVTVASKQAVKLDLLPSEEDPSAASGSSVGDSVPPTPGTAPGESGGGAGASSEKVGAKTAEGTEADPMPRLRIVAGIDIAGTMPIAGKIDNQPGTGDADQRDIVQRFGPGAGFELRAGLSIPVGRFALTPMVLLNGYTHQPGSLYNSSADRSFSLDSDSDSVMTTKPSSSSLGLAVRLDTAPQRALQLGGFGEVGLLLRQAYVTDGTWTRIGTTDGGACDFTEEFTGIGSRARAGVLMPVSRVVTLVGSVGLSLGRIAEAGLTKRSCSGNASWAAGAIDKTEVPADKRAWHAVLGLGLGAEFGIGL